MSSKDTATYWKSKITKRKIGGKESSGYYARLSHEKRQAWINLNTANRQEAAATAARTWAKLKAEGWEAVKPTKYEADDMTIGQYIKLVEDSCYLKEATFKTYARKLRQLAGEITKLDSDTSRFAPNKSHIWIEKVDKIKLSKLTTERVQEWKNARVRSVKGNVAREKAKRTRDGILRNAKSIFGEKIIRELKIQFSSVPLSEVTTRPTKCTKFVPEVDFDQLISAAHKELEGDLLTIFTLAAGCGLRRSEIDRLRQEDVNLKSCEVIVTSTEDGQTKTENSNRTVLIEKGGAAYRVLKSASMGFYVCCPTANLPRKRKAEKYRCEAQFAELVKWLRGQGIRRAEQPIHYLRKACGNKIASDSGIDVAANTLGDSIAMTYAVYSDHKRTKAAY